MGVEKRQIDRSAINGEKYYCLREKRTTENYLAFAQAKAFFLPKIFSLELTSSSCVVF